MNFSLVTGYLLVTSSVLAVERPIQAIHIHNGKSVPEEHIRAIISVKEGDTFAPEKLDEALDNLRKWGRFDTIELRIEETPRGPEIHFFLDEAILVGEIEIAGNFPYVENKIRKYLTIRPSDVYTKGRAFADIDRIKEFYSREGYFNTEIDVKETWEPEKPDVKIAFHIKRGFQIRLGGITVEGNKAYPNGRFVSAINPLRPYQPKRFSEAIRKLTNLYHKRGYPRAHIEAERNIDLDARRIDVTLRVNEGPHVKIDITGNKALSDRKIKKGIGLFEDDGVSEAEEIKDAIMEFYHQQGFPNASVSYTHVDTPSPVPLSPQGRGLGEGFTQLNFKITEGMRSLVQKIDFKGNRAFSDGRIIRQMRSRPVALFHDGLYDKELLEQDLESITEYYKSKGYQNIRVGEPAIRELRNGLSIEIPIDEDGLIKVKDVAFQFAGSDLKRLIKLLKNQRGKPLDATSLDADKEAVLKFYMDHGYPYAEVRQEVAATPACHREESRPPQADGAKQSPYYGIASSSSTQGVECSTPRNDTVEITYTITEGPLVKIGEIVTVGNFLTTRRAILKALAMKHGEPFSMKKIQQGQIALRRLGAFDAVRIETIGLENRRETVHLVVRVEEQKPFMLDLGLTYSTDERYSGVMNFTNTNAFGWGKRVGFKLTGGRELSRIELNWLDPRFFGLGVAMTTSTWLQYEDKSIFNYTQAGGGIGFLWNYQKFGVMTKYELNRNYFIGGSSTAADEESLRDNTISKVGLSLSYDVRNSFSDPTDGLFASAGSDLFNEIRGNEANFIKSKGAFESYVTVLRYLTIVHSVRLAQISTLGDNVSIPSNELLRLGGDDTLRGFTEDSLGPVNAAGDPVGGRLRWIYNGELRIKLTKKFKWAFFYDTGSLTDRFGEIDLATIRQSAGFGLRYITPVGPLRFDYGFIIDKGPGDHIGRFHFAFGYVF